MALPPPELAGQQSLCSAIADLYATTASLPFNDPFSDDLAQFVEAFDPSVEMCSGSEAGSYAIIEISASPIRLQGYLEPRNFLFVDPGQIATRTSSAVDLAKHPFPKHGLAPSIVGQDAAAQASPTRTWSSGDLASTARTRSSGDDCTAAQGDARTTLAPDAVLQVALHLPSYVRTTPSPDSLLSTTKFDKRPDAAPEGAPGSSVEAPRVQQGWPTARAGKAPRSRSTTQARSPYLAALAKPAKSLAPA